MDQDDQLWEKIKQAKDHLFTQTDFLSRYRSSTHTVHHDSHPADGTGPRFAPLAMTTVNSITNGNISGVHGDQSQVTDAKENSVPAVVVTDFSHSSEPSRSTHSSNPLPQADEKETRSFCSKGTQTPESWAVTALNSSEETPSEVFSSPSTVVPAALHSSKKKPNFSPQTRQEFPPPPPHDICRNGPVLGGNLHFVEAKHPATSKNQQASQKGPQDICSKVPVGEDNLHYVEEQRPATSKSQQAPQDIYSKVPVGEDSLHYVEEQRPATSKKATSHPINKMSGTDSSNDILLPNGKFAVNRGWVPKPQSIGQSDESTWSNQQCGSSNPKHGRSDSEKLGLGGVGVNPGRASVDVGPSQGGKAGNVKKDAEATSLEEELKELETLKKQILFNAHTRRHTYDTHSINLKFLAQVRDGPGTDSNSDVYRELMRRAAPYGISSSFQSSAGAQSASGQFNGSQEGALAKTHDSLRAAYSKSPAIYPVVENGQLLLSSEPTPEVLVYVRAIGKDFSLAVDDADLKEADQAAELKWGNTYYANWEYRPQVCSNFAAFRDWFRRWLDTTAQICCQHDVYHPAFFDGTAHPDGIKSFMFPDVDHPTTHLDMSHEETRLHAHETAEGYCHNWALQIKREEEEKKAQKVRAQAQAAHYQSLRNNSAANSQGLNPYYYIRPVELDDIPELVEVMNLAIEGGSMTLRVAPVEEHDVRERIEIAKRQMLPFLVVAERRFARHDPGDGQPRGIIGYALATEAGSDLTAARFTAELEIFIRQGHRSRGIGRCLMDKLMDVCDPTFKIRGGYFFYSSWEDNPGYVSGGRRRLSRLLFIISVPTAQLESLKWLQGWFEREFGFKQQGVLNGVRFKFNQFLTSTYMVREVGSLNDSHRN